MKGFVMLGTNDLMKSKDFYDKLLSIIGYWGLSKVKICTSQPSWQRLFENLNHLWTPDPPDGGQ